MLARALNTTLATASRPLATLAVATMALVGCTAPEAPLGQPVTQGSVSFTVTGTDFAYLELDGPTGGRITSEPVLLLNATITNAGTEPVRYDLAWGASNATQAQAPLLLVDSGAEAEPTTGTPIPRLLLNTTRYLADPVTEARTIAAGQSIDDVLLFSAPPEGASALVLSVPPGVFGANARFPGYVRIPWTATEATPPAPTPVGTAVNGESFAFTVNGSSVVWPALTNTTAQSEGFSQEPLLRIDFTATNTGEASIEYVPAAASNQFDPPTLVTSDGSPVERASFGPGITAAGAATARVPIAPGQSYNGVMYFRRPPATETELLLSLPAARLGSPGVIRVAVPYTHADPPEPAELTPRVIEQPAPQ